MLGTIFGTNRSGGGDLVIQGGLGVGTGGYGKIYATLSEGTTATNNLQATDTLLALLREGLGIKQKVPTQDLDVNGDAYIRDSTRLTTTPAHSAITGLLTRDATGWVGLASLAGGLSYTGGVLTGANIYTADGNLGDNVTRTFGQGTNGDFIQYRTTTTDKRHKTYLSIPTGNGDYDDEARVTYQVGGTKNRSITHYKGAGIYDGTGNYAASYIESERTLFDNKVTNELYASMGSGTTGNYSGFVVGADSTNLNTISAANIQTENSASPKSHWAGLVDGSYGNGGWGNFTRRMISYSPSWKVQTTAFNSNTYYDWVRIDNLDTDTTSNRISFYNNKYVFPNASPGSGDKVMIWSTGTPSFVATSSLPNIGNSDLTIPSGTDRILTLAGGTNSSSLTFYNDPSYLGSEFVVRNNTSASTYAYIQDFNEIYGKTAGKYSITRSRASSLNNEIQQQLYAEKGAGQNYLYGYITSIRNSGLQHGTVGTVMDSVGKSIAVGTFASFDSLTSGSGSKVGLFSGFGYGRHTTYNRRHSLENKSWTVQQTFGASGVLGYNWIQVRDLNLGDTTLSSVWLYEKYKFSNSTPGTGSNVHVWDNGTPSFKEIKRDTTIYIDDSDYDFSAAITTAQIASRFNRVIFWMTTTGAAASDSEITLHTPDANLMQVEYVIHSVDEAGGFANKIVFGTNNAVDSTNGLVTNYFPAAGQGVHIRAGLRSAVYKYRYY